MKSGRSFRWITATIPAAPSWLAAQTIRGIAKELNKMGTKSAINAVVPETPGQLWGEQQLFQWLAILTGSTNAHRGVGFSLGGVLLVAVGFAASFSAMAASLALALLATLVLPAEIGKMNNKPMFALLLALRCA